MRTALSRLVILSACAIVLAMVPVGATPLPACPDDVLLSTYISSYGGMTPSGGCQIGNLIFFGFQYSNGVATGGGTAPTASGIVVDTVGPASTGASLTSLLFPNDIGLEFDGNWVAPVDNSTADGDIAFAVAVANGGPAMIEDNGLAQTGGATGTGVAQVDETGCSGIVFPCTTDWANETFQSGTPPPTFASQTFFAPTGTISVSKDISVVAGSNGTAALSIVQDVLSEVPEPRSISMLLGLMLVAGLVLRKKFQSVQS